MKVSVIMPAYNAEKTISKSVESVLLQSYNDFELIIVNDGSTDGTEDIIRSLAQRDPRIRNISISNGGVSAARNVGLSKSEGEYVTFIDSDDEMEPEFIEKMISKMSDDCDLVCCGYYIVSITGEHVWGLEVDEKKYDLSNYYRGIELLQEKKLFNSLCNKLFRLSIIRENEVLLDPKVKMGEDFLFVVDYITKMKGALYCISDKLYRYKFSLGSAQATLNKYDTVDKRIKRINHLVPLYVREGYPMNSIYDEQLRYIYSSLRDNEINKDSISAILENKEIESLHYYNPQKFKMKVFLEILMTQNAFLLWLFISVFSLMKKLSGKTYKWS